MTRFFSFSRLRPLRRHAWLLVFPIVLVFVPAWYDATARVPPPAQWQRSVGTLDVLIPDNKKYEDVLSDVRVGGVTAHCAGSWLQSSNCIPGASRRADLDGQPAELLWYAQPTFPFMARPRVLELRVAGTVLIPREVTLRQIDPGPYAVLRLLGWTALVAALLLLAAWLAMDVVADKFRAGRLRSGRALRALRVPHADPARAFDGRRVRILAREEGFRRAQPGQPGGWRVDHLVRTEAGTVFQVRDLPTPTLVPIDAAQRDAGLAARGVDTPLQGRREPRKR